MKDYLSALGRITKGNAFEVVVYVLQNYSRQLQVEIKSQGYLVGARSLRIVGCLIPASYTYSHGEGFTLAYTGYPDFFGWLACQ